MSCSAGFYRVAALFYEGTARRTRPEQKQGAAVTPFVKIKKDKI